MVANHVRECRTGIRIETSADPLVEGNFVLGNGVGVHCALGSHGTVAHNRSTPMPLPLPSVHP